MHTRAFHVCVCVCMRVVLAFKDIERASPEAQASDDGPARGFCAGAFECWVRHLCHEAGSLCGEHGSTRPLEKMIWGANAWFEAGQTTWQNSTANYTQTHTHIYTADGMKDGLICWVLLFHPPPAVLH